MARTKGLSFYKKKKKVSSVIIRETFGYIFGITVTIFIAAVLVYTLGITTPVIGDSMEKSLYNGQTVYIDKIRYLFTQPKVGDVVVFLPNGNTNSHYYVKRVVAKGGDRVQILDGKVYVNGREIADSFDRDKIKDPGIAENEITLASDEYFVLGDNTNSSEDSRSANIGPVKKSDIVGRAWFHLRAEGIAPGFVR